MNMYAIKSFIEFYLKANTHYNVQSDFLHDFVNTVLDIPAARRNKSMVKTI